jgi:hypothetical protein
MIRKSVLVILIALAAGISLAAIKYNPSDTEQWEPIPAVITALPNMPPSDALVLFDGSSLNAWIDRDENTPAWTIEDGALVVNPGTGDLLSRGEFCDIQLHLEWMVPTPDPDTSGQNRSNSGVFLQDRYEVQVLDSYENETYVNGQAGAIYKQTPPLVNAMRPPNQWQSYDIIFKAPQFKGDALTAPGHITVLHNGVLIQNHTELLGKTVFIGQPSYEAHGCAPIRLQDHRNRVYYRNIWVRDL